MVYLAEVSSRNVRPRTGACAFVHKYTFLLLVHRIFQQDIAMPRCCVAANCRTISGEGYSLHEFSRDEALRAKWVQAVKHYCSNWDGPSSSSVLCSKHFEQDCFVVEGMRFRESMGIPAKRLNHNAVPMIFSIPTHGESSHKFSTPCKRTAYEKRQQKTYTQHDRFKEKAG